MKSTSPKKNTTNDLLAYGAVVGIWLLSLWLSLIPKNTEAIARYNLTPDKLHALTFTLSLPTLFIWMAILFAALSFYRYSRQISGSKDSTGFRYIALGLTFMLAGSIGGSLINDASAIASEHALDPMHVKTNFVILGNYVAVIAALGLYTCLYKGSRSLLTTIGSGLHLSKYYVKLLLPFALLASGYLYLIFANDSRYVAQDPNGRPTFGLTDPLILLTVALPYLLSWLFGFVALLGFYRYQAKTPGIFYKQLFKKLVNGMTILISLTIVLQLITQFSSFWADKDLGFILQLIAVIYIVLIAAYIMVARAAQQLNKIETLDLAG